MQYKPASKGSNDGIVRYSKPDSEVVFGFNERGSEKSSRYQRSKRDSYYRREKIQGLEMDYAEYIKMYQGFFVIRCQMMNLELAKLSKQGMDLMKLMNNFKNFSKL